MYQSIINDLDYIIKNYNPKSMSDKEKHYFLQGVSMAKQIIEQAEDFNAGESAYETLEATLKAVNSHLFRDEVNQLVDEIYEGKK